MWKTKERIQFNHDPDLFMSNLFFINVNKSDHYLFMMASSFIFPTHIILGKKLKGYAVPSIEVKDILYMYNVHVT